MVATSPAELVVDRCPPCAGDDRPYSVAMRSSGHLKVSACGQMSLPSLARKRWELQHGGAVTYLDLGDVIVIVPDGLASHSPAAR